MKLIHAVVGLSLASSVARADLSISLVDSGGNSSTSLTAGSFFDVLVKLDLDPGPQLWSGQFFLQDMTKAGVFTLMGIDVGAAAGWDSLDYNPSPAALDAGPDFVAGDIGASSVSGAGSGIMMTLHLQLSSSAGPGLYTLGLFDDPAGLLDPVFRDNVNFDQVALGMLQSYSVSVQNAPVAPAPGAATLILVGLALVGARSRRIRAL